MPQRRGGSENLLAAFKLFNIPHSSIYGVTRTKVCTRGIRVDVYDIIITYSQPESLAQ